jgi:hypothetical protein
LSATVQSQASPRWFGASYGWFQASGRWFRVSGGKEQFFILATRLILGEDMTETAFLWRQKLQTTFEKDLGP